MSGLTKQEITFTLNGKKVTQSVHPLVRLLDVVREDVGITGTKEGCGEGECGACTVLLNDKVVMSCLVPACQLDGADVVTIEGILSGGELNVIQECFLEEGGAQCGICTPGMILAALSYSKNSDTADDMREALAGNLCRCTGYTRIYQAVKIALDKMGKLKPADEQIKCV